MQHDIGEIVISLTAEGGVDDDGQPFVYASTPPSMQVRIDLPGSHPQQSAVGLLRKAADQLEAGL